MKKIKYVFLLAFLFTFLIASPSFAMTITSVDDDGNRTVLFSADSEDLEVNPFLPVTLSDNVPPSPDIVAKMIDSEDLQNVLSQYSIPDAAGFLFLDFGPNWENIYQANGSNIKLSGRYGYVFCGIRDGSSVVSGVMDTGSGKYDYNDNSHRLVMNGPFAFLSYNDEQDQIYINNHCYGDWMDYAYELEFTDIFIDSDTANSGSYPRVITYGDDISNPLELGSYKLSNNFTKFEWNDNYNSGVDDSDELDSSFWDFLTNGWYTQSDNPIVVTLTSALVNMAEIVSFVASLPSYTEDLFSFLPSEFLNFIKITIGVMVTVLLMKFALYVLK